jgi:hypothetical protein
MAPIPTSKRSFVGQWNPVEWSSCRGRNRSSALDPQAIPNDPQHLAHRTHAKHNLRLRCSQTGRQCVPQKNDIGRRFDERKDRFPSIRRNRRILAPRLPFERRLGLIRRRHEPSPRFEVERRLHHDHEHQPRLLVGQEEVRQGKRCAVLYFRVRHRSRSIPITNHRQDASPVCRKMVIPRQMRV